MAKLHVHMQFVAGWRASALRQHRCVGGSGARRRVRDGAISHCLQVDACRSVRNGCCVAIDLIAGDTRPDVYGPSHTAPFTVQAARVRLQQALAAMRWNSGNCRRPGVAAVAFTHKSLTTSGVDDPVEPHYLVVVGTPDPNPGMC